MSCHISLSFLLSVFWSLVSPSLIKAFELIGMVEHTTCVQRMECQPACQFERQMNHWRGSSIKRDCFGREGVKVVLNSAIGSNAPCASAVTT